MKKPSRRNLDVNELAFETMRLATGTHRRRSYQDMPTDQVPTTKKNPAAVALGKLGGKKGGPARAEKLSARQRSAIARRAAKKRWVGKR